MISQALALIIATHASHSAMTRTRHHYLPDTE